MHTLQFDCCFKLPLLNWRNYGLAYPAPANRRIIASNADVQQFTAAAEGYLQTSTTGECTVCWIGLWHTEWFNLELAIVGLECSPSPCWVGIHMLATAGLLDVCSIGMLGT